MLLDVVQGVVNKKCPSCGEAELVRGRRNMPYTYKGESIIIRAVTGDYCQAWGEKVLDAAESTHSSAGMLEFNKQVNTTNS